MSDLGMPAEMADVKPDLQAMPPAAAVPTADAAAVKDDGPAVAKAMGGKPKEVTDGWLCGFCGATFDHRHAFKVRG